jgi:hypothetical protein
LTIAISEIASGGEVPFYDRSAVDGKAKREGKDGMGWDGMGIARGAGKVSDLSVGDDKRGVCDCGNDEKGIRGWVNEDVLPGGGIMHTS